VPINAFAENHATIRIILVAYVELDGNRRLVLYGLQNFVHLLLNLTFVECIRSRLAWNGWVYSKVGEVGCSGWTGECLFTFVACWKGFAAFDGEGDVVVCCVEDVFVGKGMEWRMSVWIQHNPVERHDCSRCCGHW
jgi:hypothetical protein